MTAGTVAVEGLVDIRKAIMDKDIEAEMQVLELTMVGSHAVARSQYLMRLVRLLKHGVGLAEQLMVHRNFPVNLSGVVMLQAAHCEQESMQCWLDANEDHLRDIEHGWFASCAVGGHMVRAFGCIFHGVQEMWEELLTGHMVAMKDRFPRRVILEDPQLLTTQELQQLLGINIDVAEIRKYRHYGKRAAGVGFVLEQLSEE